MADQNVCYLSATELGERIAAGDVSSAEATEAYLQRIGELDGNYASYITVTADRAREDARRADAELAAGNRRGPLHGVPVAVKDQFDTAGIATTNGSTILAENIPGADATVMARLKDAGTVLLGKLNMSEYASGDAFRHPYGRPRVTHGTPGATREPPAAVPGRPPRPSCAPHLWARTPAAASAGRRPSADWWASGQPSAGSAATVSLAPAGPWTP